MVSVWQVARPASTSGSNRLKDGTQLATPRIATGALFIRDIIVDPRPPAERWPRKGVTKIKAVLQQGAL